MEKCFWCKDGGILEKYHDEEWGVPVHDERKHFMYLLMESMSCGLSWKMMLQRREAFREGFADFDYEKVADFGDADVERALKIPGMIKSERKIRAIINNAQQFIKIRKEWKSFDRYIWHFTEGKTMIYPEHQTEWCVRNELSDEIAKDLKKRGFKYLGSVIIYSHLQGIGIINDHMKNCFRYQQSSL